MIDPVLPQSRAFRLLLAALETDEAGSVDAMSRIITEADHTDGLVEVALALVDLLTDVINHSQRRRDWIAYLSLRLPHLLDQLGAEP